MLNDKNIAVKNKSEYLFNLKVTPALIDKMVNKIELLHEFGDKSSFRHFLDHQSSLWVFNLLDETAIATLPYNGYSYLKDDYIYGNERGLFLIFGEENRDSLLYFSGLEEGEPVLHSSAAKIPKFLKQKYDEVYTQFLIGDYDKIKTTFSSAEYKLWINKVIEMLSLLKKQTLIKTYSSQKGILRIAKDTFHQKGRVDFYFNKKGLKNLAAFLQSISQTQQDTISPPFYDNLGNKISLELIDYMPEIKTDASCWNLYNHPEYQKICGEKLENFYFVAYNQQYRDYRHALSLEQNFLHFRIK